MGVNGSVSKVATRSPAPCPSVSSTNAGRLEPGTISARSIRLPGVHRCQPLPRRPRPAPAPPPCAAVAYSEVSQSESINNGVVTMSRTATCLCANGTRITIRAVFDSAGNYVGPESSVKRACAPLPASCRVSRGSRVCQAGGSGAGSESLRDTHLWHTAAVLSQFVRQISHPAHPYTHPDRCS